jgi:hypothetical protein
LICYVLTDGTGLFPIKIVGDMYGYSIVAIDLGLDVFLIRNDILDGIPIPSYEYWSQYAAKLDEKGLYQRPAHSNFPHCWSIDDIPVQGRKGFDKLNFTSMMDNYLVNFMVWFQNGRDAFKAGGHHVFNEFHRYGMIPS